VWQGKVKDLGFVRDATPAEVLLVDDQERVIDPAQRDRWIAVAEWDDPAVTADRELGEVALAPGDDVPTPTGTRSLRPGIPQPG
jgi:hypothetical protein